MDFSAGLGRVREFIADGWMSEHALNVGIKAFVINQTMNGLSLRQANSHAMQFHVFSKYFALLITIFTMSDALPAQSADGWKWLVPSDTLNTRRLRTTAALGATFYAATSLGLYHAWYKGYDLGKFRTFDDSREWNQVDKGGHLLTAYYETRVAYEGARWTGLDKRRSLWVGGAVGTVLQGTVEVMDGFSEKWGFSWSDMAFNTIGSVGFIAQQMAWNEQRVLFKVSNSYEAIPDATLTSTDGTATTQLATIYKRLYGTTAPERFFKDYNTITTWASVNVRAFAPNSRLPKWLNVAVGYGAGNIYGGFTNEWTDDNGNTFQLSPSEYPRYRQWYLSADIDFQRIPTQKRWLRTAFSLLNFIKFPAPALEYNTLGKFKLHPIFF